MAIRKDSGELKSGELAAAARVSVDTLRHYERRGLLAPARRLSNGYRIYPRAAVSRVQLIQRALSVGFGLDELARVLKSRDRGQAPCREVRALAEGKLAEVEAQIESLTVFRDRLRRTLADWDRRLGSRAATESAGLLESLVFDAEDRKKEGSTGSTFWKGARFDNRRKKKERP